LAVLIGGAVGGGFGLLFAVPVAACLKIFCEEVVLPSLHLWASRH
jgi:predicted PurR-regulated permease PerM